MGQVTENELLIEMLGAPVVEMSGGHYYDVPEGFKKPKSYPGLGGGKGQAAMDKGYVDVGLINPNAKTLPKNKVVRSAVVRGVVKLLVRSAGKEAFIHDPEWALKVLYEGQMVKTALKDHVQEALEAMFDMTIPVTISGFKGKTGFGWRFKALALAKHPKVAA